MPAARHVSLSGNASFRPIDLDGEVSWGCSLKGWNCCVDKAVFLRPYDVLRLRHAVGAPASEVIERYASFAWSNQSGTLMALLQRDPQPARPPVSGREPCLFYEEVTNVSAREMREADPERFAGLPPRLQRAADSDAPEWVAAALCQAHRNRPEVCRGLPFQRFVEAQEDGELAVDVRTVHRCGTCAIAETTTPRRLFAEDGIHEYWRALDAYWQVERYLVALGAANVEHESYARLPVDPLEIWRALYLADDAEVVGQRFPEQWSAPLDEDGDREIFALLLEHVLDRVDGLADEVAGGRATLGLAGEQPPQRPDVRALLDPQRPVYAPPPQRAA
jgi:hypothetical protein